MRLLVWAVDTLDGLPISWPTLGTGSLLALCVLLILTGRLVPRSTLRDMQADRDAWRAVALASTSQSGQLMVGAQVASDVLKALPDARRPSDPT